MIDFGKRVLVPIDFSPGSTRALRVAASLLARLGGGGTLFALHVGSPTSPPAGTPDDARALVDREETLERGELARFVRNSLPDERHVETLVRYGAPADQIVAAAAAVRADLIAMGTHGRRGVPRLVLGSVAEAVAHRAPCSVLTVRHPDSPAREAKPFTCESILVPTDLSEAARAAEDLALRMAGAAGAELHVLHVADGKGWGTGALDQLLHAQERVRDAVDRLQRRSRGGNGRAPSALVVEHSRAGNAAAEIAACAEEIRAGLVVIASHGHGGLARKLIGGTTDRLIRTSSCPVLTVRAGTDACAKTPMEIRERAPVTDEATGEMSG